MKKMILKNGKLNILSQVKKYQTKKIIVCGEEIEIPDCNNPYYEVEIEISNSQITFIE